MNVIRFLSLCAIVGIFVLLLGTINLPPSNHEALAAVEAGGMVLGFPFGGKVLAIRPCNTGFLVTITPLRPFFLVEVMWTPATVGFLYNLKAPPVPSQWILGRAQGFLTCVVGKVPVGGGPIITFYGSSIPSPK